MRITKVFKKRAAVKVDDVAERRIPSEWLYEQSAKPFAVSCLSSSDACSTAAAERKYSTVSKVQQSLSDGQLHFDLSDFKRGPAARRRSESFSSTDSGDSDNVFSSAGASSSRSSWAMPSPALARSFTFAQSAAASPFVTRRRRGSRSAKRSLAADISAPGSPSRSAFSSDSDSADSDDDAEADPASHFRQRCLKVRGTALVLRQPPAAGSSSLSLPRTVSNSSLNELFEPSTSSAVEPASASSALPTPTQAPSAPRQAYTSYFADDDIDPLTPLPHSASFPLPPRRFHSLPNSPTYLAVPMSNGAGLGIGLDLTQTQSTCQRPTSLLHARALAQAAQKELRQSFKDSFLLDLGGNRKLSLGAMPSPTIEFTDPFASARRSSTGAAWI